MSFIFMKRMGVMGALSLSLCATAALSQESKPSDKDAMAKAALASILGTKATPEPAPAPEIIQNKSLGQLESVIQRAYASPLSNDYIRQLEAEIGAIDPNEETVDLSLLSDRLEALVKAATVEGSDSYIAMVGDETEGPQPTTQVVPVEPRALPAAVQGNEEIVSVSVVDALTTDRPEYVIIQRGDTLSGIANKYYGDAALFPMIAAANEMTNPSQLNVGQRIKLP